MIMNNRNKRLAVLFMVLMAPLSMAVQVNQKGLGEVLIYPYYTVNNDLNTLYSVVNTTPDTKALAVRFMEGDNGMEVLNFNIYLLFGRVFWFQAFQPKMTTMVSPVLCISLPILLVLPF